jgi:hypothetical protein
MPAELGRLRTGEKLAGACAVLLLIDMFLSWYGVDVGGGASALLKANGVSTTASAWTAFSYTDLLMFILLALALVWVGLAVTQRAPAMPIALNVIVTFFGALVTLIVLYRILNQPGPNDFITVKFGAYLGFLLCVGITAGGFLAMRDEGTSMADARAQAEGLLSSRQTTRPAGTEPDAGASTGAPPASTPPAGTPPASTPPASTPPEESSPSPGSQGGSVPPPSQGPPTSG